MAEEMDCKHRWKQTNPLIFQSIIQIANTYQLLQKDSYFTTIKLLYSYVFKY